MSIRRVNVLSKAAKGANSGGGVCCVTVFATDKLCGDCEELDEERVDIFDQNEDNLSLSTTYSLSLFFYGQLSK